MTCQVLDLFNARVVLLQALHRAMSVPCSGDALHGVVCTGKRRDVGNLVLDGGLADGAFVLDGVALCPRRVDDEVHLLVQDNIQNVRAAFGDLVHHFALDASLFVELGGAFGCVDLKAQFLENTVSRVQRPRLRGHCRGKGVSVNACPLRLPGRRGWSCQTSKTHGDTT